MANANIESSAARSEIYHIEASVSSGYLLQDFPISDVNDEVMARM